MDYIINYFNNQAVTKIRNEQTKSYYISHVQHNPSNIFIVVAKKDDYPFYQPIEISKLHVLEINNIPNKNNWSEVKTIFHVNRCKAFIINDMWCEKIDIKPYENKIIFRLNNSNVFLTVDVKNKDTSIYHTDELQLRQLIEDFNYKLQFM